MRTNDFKEAVDEIRNNGGSRQTVYIREAWRDRCMTIFSYADGTAEIYEDTHLFMAFSSKAEAITILTKMQESYNRQASEDRKKIVSKSSNLHIDTYTSAADWYARAPRGTYWGD